jgi:hypothetical protein
MDMARIRYAILGTLSFIWLHVILPHVIRIMGLGPIIFPRPPISMSEKHLLIATSTVMIISSLIFALIEFKNLKKSKPKSKKSLLPLMFLIIISIPIVSAYVFQQDLQNLTQTILDAAVMDEDFTDVIPGDDPPGWAEESGNWFAVDDNGNMVYYQDDFNDAEALSISTTGDPSWTDYTFEVDLKFVEGNPSKNDRAAILAYRYTSGNDYYFLALREAQDQLDVYKHGTGSGGHLVGSTPCTLAQDTWYHVNITIIGNNVWISIDDTPYFTGLNMQGDQTSGMVGIGTRYYKVMFDNIYVELK